MPSFWRETPRQALQIRDPLSTARECHLRSGLFRSRVSLAIIGPESPAAGRGTGRPPGATWGEYLGQRRLGGWIANWMANAQWCRPRKRHTSVARMSLMRPRATSWAQDRLGDPIKRCLASTSRGKRRRGGRELQMAEHLADHLLVPSMGWHLGVGVQRKRVGIVEIQL